jgi:hypothetical protein
MSIEGKFKEQYCESASIREENHALLAGKVYELDVSQYSNWMLRIVLILMVVCAWFHDYGNVSSYFHLRAATSER